MGENPGATVAGWGTAPFAIALCLLVLMALWTIVAAVRADVPKVMIRVALIGVGVIIAVTSISMAFAQPETSIDGERLGCGATADGALSEAFLKGVPSDDVLNRSQLGCRRTSRLYAVAAFAMPAVSSAVMEVVRLRARRQHR